MKKFSVILLHYNQMSYIEEAIKSVCSQTYENIELIVTDDCSKEFNESKIEKIIKKYNKKSYEYKIFSEKENVGTTKHLNNTLDLVTGEYILFFAADDRLSNENVIERFATEFLDESKNVLTAQCLLYDEELKKKKEAFVKRKVALALNEKSAIEQFGKMAEACFYGAGATAYRKSIFKKYGYFNVNYKYVEDWAYWLHILRNGEKMYYVDFEALDHRDGGISHSEYTPQTLPMHVRQYYYDILNIYEGEILPYFEKLETENCFRILRQQQETILYYSKFVPELIKYLDGFDNARTSNVKIKKCWKKHTVLNIISDTFNPHIIKKILVLFKYNRAVPITVIIWFMINLYMSLFTNLKVKEFYFYMLLSYVILYYVIYIIDKSIYYLIKIYKAKRGKKNV